jgi:hypothetical protein
MVAPSEPDVTIEANTPIHKQANGLLFTTSRLRFADGGQAGRYVFAFPKADGTTAFTMLTTSEVTNVEAIMARLQSLDGIMGQLMQGRPLGDSPKTATVSGPVAGPVAGDAQTASSPPAVSKSSTAAATLPPTKDIAAVYHHSELIMAGCCLNTFLTTTVLFKDGRACDCLDDWIADPSLAAFLAKPDAEMGCWRKTGASYKVTYPGKEEGEVRGSLIKPLPAGKRIDHAYANSQARGGSAMSRGLSTGTVKTSGFLDLHPDGTFSRQSGSQFVLDGPITEAWAGRYFIDGYAIRLEYGDGTREIKSLLTFEDSDDSIVFADKIYGQCMSYQNGETRFTNCRDDQ